jgi:hypothetical protein
MIAGALDMGIVEVTEAEYMAAQPETQTET